MKARLILVSLGLFALAIFSLGLNLKAQERTKNPTQEKDDIITSEQQLARLFADFQDHLLRLKQKLARGSAEEKKSSQRRGVPGETPTARFAAMQNTTPSRGIFQSCDIPREDHTIGIVCHESCAPAHSALQLTDMDVCIGHKYAFFRDCCWETHAGSS